MKGFAASVAVSVAYGAAVARAITPITVKGNAFFAGSQRFYIRGVDYQPGGASGAGTVSGVADPLADEAGCKRDLPYFKQLGINTIRVYTVDNTANHDACMQMLEAAGIYLAVDVNSPNYSLNRNNPAPSYNNVYLANVFATMDVFAKYPNTLLFISGNEVINNAKTTAAAPYIKAVVRDMKEYRDKQKMRPIPIGYSAADVSQNREQTAEYLNCGAASVRSDFFAFNDYSWCDPSSFTQSGWSTKVQTYKSYSIPLFLSEYGCITNVRKWQEVASLYNPQEMTMVYSGGLAFEYSEEGDGYGLVNINGNTVSPKPDFNYLKTAFAKTPNPSGSGGWHTGSPSKCPPASPNWDVHTDALPPIPAPAKKYMTQGAPKGYGLNGPGSQNAGTPSTGIPGANGGSSKSGSSTSGGSSTSHTPGAAAGLHIPEMSLVAPALVGLAVFASSLFGASLL